MVRKVGKNATRSQYSRVLGGAGSKSERLSPYPGANRAFRFSQDHFAERDRREKTHEYANQGDFLRKWRARLVSRTGTLHCGLWLFRIC